ncbi:MAG: hypothetical protein HC814_04365 [Rhodobacteraceae bacterium]|nr:hypothetical protein [Paracoccaceae bacterium]
MRRGSLPLSIITGIAALVLGVLAEWRLAPFKTDSSLGYFLSHLHQLRPLTLIMIGIGAYVCFWMPFRAGRRQSR